MLNTLKNEDFTGVDAVLVAVPYYNKPSQEGIYQHYKAIAEATDLPVVLYNVPGRTGVNMTAETTLRLARDFKGEFRRNLGRRRYYLPADYLGSRGRYLRYRKCLSA